MTVIDFLDAHSIPYDASGRGKNRPGWTNIRCPRCGRYPYLGIHNTLLYMNSWCCGYFPIYDTLSQLTRVPATEIKTLIGNPNFLPAQEKPQGVYTPPMGLEAAIHPAHQLYLQKRGFHWQDLVRLWDIGSIGILGGRLAHRIFIPVYKDGRIVTYTTRRVTNQEPRYVSAYPTDSATPIVECLYGIDYVRHSTVVVEGAVDVWRLGPGAVGLLRGGASASQLEQLAAIPLRAIALDAEPQAQDRADALAKSLSVFPGRTVIVRLESGKDIAAADPREVSEIRRRYLA